jgi:hypothetical protein
MMQYRDLPEATPEQERDARNDAELFMQNGGKKLYCSYAGLASSAIFDFILFTKGLQAKRSSN